MSTVLYNDSYSIGIDELNKIYLALLTVADKVYINGNVEVDWQVVPIAYKHIQDNLKILQAEGYLVFWHYPNERAVSKSEIVIDKNQYLMWDDIINKTFFNSEKTSSMFYYLATGKSFLDAREENTSKILLIRREYWTYALLEMLKADKVMNYFPGWMPNYESIPSITTTSIEDLAVHSIFSEISSSVFALSANDVIAIHKKNKKLRASLNSKTDRTASSSNDVISTLLSEAISANQEIVRSEKYAMIENGVDLSVTLAGIVADLTPVGFIFNQLTNAKDIGQGLYNAFGALYGADKDRNIFYLLIKMKRNLNRMLKRAKKSHFA